MEKAIYPGQLWKDTDGKPIQAHGGSVYFEDGIYYWYGENKEFTTGKENIWHWGVRCYSSTDLCCWEDRGIIIPPETENEASTLHPFAMMDRPHIIYNKSTKKYVCWMKIMNPGQGTQSMTICVSDHFLGPYEKVRENFRPLNMNSGDFDLAVAEDGKAYIYFERVHTETICADLTEDYCGVTGYYSTHFPKSGPPFVREATAHFIRKGKHYLLTSGTTGYLPNPSEIAVAETWHGPYTVLGNPILEDKSNTSFHSQISSVFRVNGEEDLYIAVADRWAPDLLDINYEAYGKIYEELFQNHNSTAYQTLMKYGDDTHRCTKDARYVWLPLCFEGDRPYIKWLDRWMPTKNGGGEE